MRRYITRPVRTRPLAAGARSGARPARGAPECARHSGVRARQLLGANSPPFGRGESLIGVGFIVRFILRFFLRSAPAFLRPGDVDATKATKTC